MKEIVALAKAMDLPLPDDIIPTNLKILEALNPAASTSMHRDLAQGKQSELDGLVFEPVRLSRRYNVSMPAYEKLAAALGFND